MMGRILSLAVLVALICAAPTPAHAGGILLGIGSCWRNRIGHCRHQRLDLAYHQFLGRLVSSL